MIEPGSQSIMETAYVKAVIAPFFTNPTTLARICRRHHAW